jgi:hypothetical protein
VALFIGNLLNSAAEAIFSGGRNSSWGKIGNNFS